MAGLRVWAVSTCAVAGAGASGTARAQMDVPAAETADGATLFKRQCATCHSLAANDAPRLTSGAGCNPTLTIVALAVRQADHIVEQMGRNNI